MRPIVNPDDYAINFNSDGLGSFSSQTRIDSRGAYTLFAEDLDDDNALDIIDGNLGIMLGNGDGSFGPIIECGHGSALRLARSHGRVDRD